MADRNGPRPPPRSTIPAKRSAADAQEDAWVADEDKFVLRQSKKKALIRVRAGRSDPIDLLAVTLRALDNARDGYNSDDDDDDEEELPVVDPEGVFEGLDDEQLSELEQGIDNYLVLEKSRSNRDFWNMMKVICRDRLQYSRNRTQAARGMSSISPDLDKLLAPKTYEQLETLDKQVKQKLKSNEPIDVDYWENLLKSISIYKAKARLRHVSQSLLGARLDTLRRQQAEDANAFQDHLRQSITLTAQPAAAPATDEGTADKELARAATLLDPEPFLKLNPEDKALASVEVGDFTSKLLSDRRRVLKLGFIPARSGTLARDSTTGALTHQRRKLTHDSHASGTTSALYEREAARGFGDNEVAFAVEEELDLPPPSWANKYKPRKPLYFNRVQMGYEWNKYNQTHYDHDNPPPKVVQGYKFNIFYPDLVDATKAPTFKIERENGRKRGQSFAPAGEDDSCLIRFIAGPPYQDIAFRIVDKEWDYSAKRDRNFRSSFDKGILQLHFQFKKVYYRK
ncbi:hypothetical protein AAFC00_000488 [Neodothiora populina]|uniref:Splicing factor Cactin n=1 Tax=Neodothiora populina TaxID=2781224 RepID=A0ABR3PD44_9PEZI